MKKYLFELLSYCARMSNNGVVPGVWVIVNSELKSEESIARWVGIGSTDRLMKVSGDQGAVGAWPGSGGTPTKERSCRKGFLGKHFVRK